MTHWARPGVKCVYVGRPEHKERLTRAPLIFGRVYTIREVITHPETGEVGMYLHGVVNEIHPKYLLENGYVISAFRPLVTRTQEQDMELLTPLLDVHNHEELERV